MSDLTREQIEDCLQQARRDDWHIEMDPGKIRVLCDMAARTERAEAELQGNSVDIFIEEARAVKEFIDMKERAERAEAELAAKQAHIDRLMLEYCPDEMTATQMAEWASHQRAAPAAPTKEDA